MPSKSVNHLVDKVSRIETLFFKHLDESVGIRVQLKVNTILTSLILAVIIGKVLVETFFK